jgi:hypothetical protein
VHSIEHAVPLCPVKDSLLLHAISTQTGTAQSELRQSHSMSSLCWCSASSTVQSTAGVTSGVRVCKSGMHADAADLIQRAGVDRWVWIQRYHKRGHVSQPGLPQQICTFHRRSIRERQLLHEHPHCRRSLFASPPHSMNALLSSISEERLGEDSPSWAKWVEVLASRTRCPRQGSCEIR